MPRTFTPRQAAEAIDGFRRRFVPGLVPAVERVLDDIVRGSKREFRSHSLFQGEGAPRLDVKRAAVRATEDKLEGGIEADGMAAIMEAGGKTRPHRIVPKRGRVLAFERGGRTVFARHANHPGSRFEPFRIIEKEAESNDRSATVALERKTTELIQRAGLD